MAEFLTWNNLNKYLYTLFHNSFHEAIWSEPAVFITVIGVLLFLVAIVLPAAVHLITGKGRSVLDDDC